MGAHERQRTVTEGGCAKYTDGGFYLYHENEDLSTQQQNSIVIIG